jgi:RNA polymerase sigma factor (sigma-70 family)
MSATQSILRHIRQQANKSVTDAALLRQFIERRDHTAFECIVQRHGPMVLAVCRRRLDDLHSAEDAFQATFLALSKSARSIRQSDSLAGWLFRTAQRIAAKARATANRRSNTERQSVRQLSRDPQSELSARDLLEVLDMELGKLAERDRLPLLLVYWQNRTYAQAARELGLTVSALHGRLERGRKRLAERLHFRGFTPADLGAILAAMTTIAVPGDLLAKTAALSASGAIVPASVAALGAAGSSKAISAAVAAVVLAAGTIGMAGGWAEQEKADEKAKPRSTVVQDSRPPEVRPRVDREGVPLPAGAIARLGSARMRHSWLRDVIISPDGESLMSFSGVRDDSIRKWNTATGKQISQFPQGGSRYQLMRFSPDGKSIIGLVAGINETFYCAIDAATGRELRKSEIGSLVWTAAAISLSGKLIAVYWHDSRSITIYDAEAQREIARIPEIEALARSLSISANDQLLAMANTGDTVKVYDLKTKALVAELQDDGVQNLFVEFSPDCQTLSAIAVNKAHVQPRVQPLGDEIHLWDLKTKKIRQVIRDKELVSTHHVAFSPDGRCLASSSQQLGVFIWDAQTGKQVRRFQSTIGAQKVAFSPDSRTLAIAGIGGGISLWELSTGRLLPASANPVDLVRQIWFAADGRHLFAMADRPLCWEIASGEQQPRFANLATVSTQTVLSPDAKFVAVGGESIKLLDATTGRQLNELKSEDGPVTRMMFSPDARKLVVRTNYRVLRVYDTQNGSEQLKIEEPADTIDPLAISPDGRWLAWATVKGGLPGIELRIWDVTEFKEKRRISVPDGEVVMASFSPNSGRIATIILPHRNSTGRPQYQLKLWDRISGLEIRTDRSLTYVPRSLTYAPDGRTVAIGGGDGCVYIWDTLLGKERHRFEPRKGQIFALAYSSDGCLLASSDFESPICVWETVGKSESHVPLTTQQLDRIFAELTRDDAGVAYQAIRRLVASPAATVAHFREKLAPAPSIELTKLRELVSNLDDSKFEIRQQALHQLERIAVSAAIQLRAELAAAKSAEVRQSIQRLLDRLNEPTPELLRTVRSIEVLEHIATPAARELLADLAKGAPGARLTEEAKASLSRLNSR